MKRRRPTFFPFLVLLAGLGVAVASAQPAQAQDSPQDSQSDYSHTRVVRLSFVIGDVQYQSLDQDWQTAPMNLPIQEGFRLATTDGRAEVEFESGLIVRLAEHSGIEFTKLALENSSRVSQLTLMDGSILATVNLKIGDSFSVIAPNLQMSVPHSAKLRMDTSQGDTWVEVFKGDVQITTGAGDSRLTGGHTLHKSAGENGQISIEANGMMDDFDRWGNDRDRVIAQGDAQVLQYLPTTAPDYADYDYGLSDLASYGQWTFISGYGYGWQPYGVGTAWTPFGNGCWNYFGGGFGWTWLSFEPWGWLPFHTGHWLFLPVRGWIWEPGPFRHWDPAPVHWLYTGNQMAWAPRGAMGFNGEPPANGIVSGFRDSRGIIRPSGEPVTPGTVLKFTSGAAPAPIIPRRVMTFGNTGGGLRARPVDRMPVSRGAVYDPVTNTYVNGNPPVKNAPVNSGLAPSNSKDEKSSNNLVKDNNLKDNNTKGDQNVPVRPVHSDGNSPQRNVVPQTPTPAQQPHYTPPPAPPATHSSPPSPPASHSSGGSSGGGHSGGSSGGHH